MYKGMRFRIDWCNVQRRVAQNPHMRFSVGSHAGRPALIRGKHVVATTPKAAMDAIDNFYQLALDVAA